MFRGPLRRTAWECLTSDPVHGLAPQGRRLGSARFDAHLTAATPWR
jgi:hypothetical protein